MSRRKPASVCRAGSRPLNVAQKLAFGCRAKKPASAFFTSGDRCRTSKMAVAPQAKMLFCLHASKISVRASLSRKGASVTPAACTANPASGRKRLNLGQGRSGKVHVFRHGAEGRVPSWCITLLYRPFHSCRRNQSVVHLPLAVGIACRSMA